MNILFELLYIDREESAGVHIYAYNLIKHYAEAHPEDKLTVLCLNSVEEHIRYRVGNSDIQFVGIGESECKIYSAPLLLRIKRFIKLMRFMRKYDICISTFANNSRLGMWPFVKQIGVVHDLQTQILMSQGMSKKMRWFMGVKWRLRFWRYRKLVTISDKVKKDLRAYCGRNAVRIYNPCGYLASDEKTIPGFDEDTDYILDVNTLCEYKNAGILIEAFSEIKDEFPSLILYIKGKDFGYQTTLDELIKEHKLNDRVLIDTVDRDSTEITWLFNHAKIFVTPSLMEGFGLTPVEAVMAKVPVIASDIDTLREVLGDCAAFFNPHSKSELVSLLRQYLNNPLAENELNRRAAKLSETFSKHHHIENYYKLFHGLSRCAK